MSARARSESSGTVSRYRNNRRTAQRTPWQSGPANSIDRLIDQGLSASEISAELQVARWVVVERFAAREAIAS